MRAALGLAAICLAVGPAAAQRLEAPTCYPELGPANALAVAVDGAGVAHLSRYKNVPADLMYTAIGPDGAVQRDEVVLARANDIARPVRETDLVVQGGQPRICFHQPFGSLFRVAVRDPQGGWALEQVDEGPRVGEHCRLLVHDGALVVFYVAGGALKRGVRQGPGDWRTEVVFAGEGGLDAGDEVTALVDQAGRQVAVHRSSDGRRLYVSRQDGAGWAHETVFPDGAPFGLRIAAAQAPDGELLIVHGRTTDNVDVGPDLGLFLTRGPIEGPLLSDEIRPATSSGGSNALAVLGVGEAQRVALLTRERRRSALVGNRDAIAFLPSVERNLTGVVREAVAGSSRDFHPLHLRRLPDGRALVAWYEVIPAENLLQLCVLRVQDGDGDDLPDALEGGPLGTRPDVADTDDDGRSDGREVLDDQTDPLVPDDAPEAPDQGVEDMAAPDMEPLDMAVPDMAEPDAAVPDMAEPDAAVPDMAEPDAAVPDMAEPDAAVPDMAEPDAAAPDMAEPDAAVRDMETPDVAAPDMRAPVVDLAAPVDGGVADQALAPDEGPIDAAPALDSALAADAAPLDASPPDGRAPDARAADARPRPTPRDARPPRDGAPRYDGELPPLTSLTPPRDEPSCGGCDSAPGPGLIPLWLLLLALPRRRK